MDANLNRILYQNGFVFLPYKCVLAINIIHKANSQNISSKATIGLVETALSKNYTPEKNSSIEDIREEILKLNPLLKQDTICVLKSLEIIDEHFILKNDTKYISDYLTLTAELQNLIVGGSFEG